MKLDSQWITGFVDGEGTFYVRITEHSEKSAGYQVIPEFRVVQHKKDIQVLYALKEFFGCGVVRINHGDRYEFRVRSLKHLSQIIVPFFQKYSLRSKKRIDFLKFRKIIKLMENGKHLKPEGILKIIRIARQMNRCRKPITEQFEREIRVKI